jgi:hypothetical protein
VPHEPAVVHTGAAGDQAPPAAAHPDGSGVRRTLLMTDAAFLSHHTCAPITRATASSAPPENVARLSCLLSPVNGTLRAADIAARVAMCDTAPPATVRLRARGFEGGEGRGGGRGRRGVVACSALRCENSRCRGCRQCSTIPRSRAPARGCACCRAPRVCSTLPLTLFPPPPHRPRARAAGGRVPRARLRVRAPRDGRRAVRRRSDTRPGRGGWPAGAGRRHGGICVSRRGAALVLSPPPRLT